MPKGDPAGYLPNVKAARKQGAKKAFGKKIGGRPFGKKSAPAQRALRAGGRFGGK